MINVVAAQNVGGENLHALSLLAVGALAFGLASFALTRKAAKLTRIPIVAALIGGGWMFFGVGLLLGPVGFHFLTSESLTELRGNGSRWIARQACSLALSSPASR